MPSLIRKTRIWFASCCETACSTDSYSLPMKIAQELMDRHMKFLTPMMSIHATARNLGSTLSFRIENLYPFRFDFSKSGGGSHSTHLKSSTSSILSILFLLRATLNLGPPPGAEKKVACLHIGMRHTTHFEKNEVACLMTSTSVLRHRQTPLGNMNDETRHV